MFRKKKERPQEVYDVGPVESGYYTSVECDELWSNAIRRIYGPCSCDDRFLVANVRVTLVDLSENVFDGEICDYSCLSCDWTVNVENG